MVARSPRGRQLRCATTPRSSRLISAKRRTRSCRRRWRAILCAMPVEMLQISGVHTFYGNIEALRGVDLKVPAGEIVTLIGANGAGKSTLLMTICGQPRASRGRIDFEGIDITRWPTHAI